MNYRSLCLSGFLVCLLLIAAAMYFQHVEGLEPCPLCIFQRVAFIVLGVIFLVAGLHNPRGLLRRVYAVLAMTAGAAGAAIAGRHVWLQNIPEDQVPECGPGLEFMLEVLPFQTMIKNVLRGSGECAEVVWTLFGLSMPTWSLIWLVALTLLAAGLCRIPAPPRP